MSAVIVSVDVQSATFRASKSKGAEVSRDALKQALWPREDRSVKSLEGTRPAAVQAAIVAPATIGSA